MLSKTIELLQKKKKKKKTNPYPEPVFTDSLNIQKTANLKKPREDLNVTTEKILLLLIEGSSKSKFKK